MKPSPLAFALSALSALSLGGIGCSTGGSGSEPTPASTSSTSSSGALPPDPQVDAALPGTVVDAGIDAAPIDAGPSAPVVDRTDPQRYTFSFTALQADPAATQAPGTQGGALDTRVVPRGKLVVHLHGAGAPTNCVAEEMSQVLTGMGFHVFMPCYRADYGVGSCGNDIGGCRREAFEGVDHSSVVTIGPSDSIETRIVKGLTRLQAQNPKGDWQFFIDNGKPRWSSIVISGISHGASTAGLIGKLRTVDRVVMLSGALDTNQAWLALPSLTTVDRFYGFSHTADDQHAGHLASWTTMTLSGAPTSVDGASPPYGGTHRLITSAPTTNGHSSVQAGGVSPKTGTAYTFAPVWTYLYL